MKACCAALESIKKVRPVERNIEPAPDQILVKIHSASICLADIQMYRKGYYYPGQQLNFPVYLGHEGGGIGSCDTPALYGKSRETGTRS